MIFLGLVFWSMCAYICVYMCVHEHTQAFAAVFRCRGSKYKQLCEVLYGKDICGWPVSAGVVIVRELAFNITVVGHTWDRWRHCYLVTFNLLFLEFQQYIGLRTPSEAVEPTPTLTSMSVFEHAGSATFVLVMCTYSFFTVTLCPINFSKLKSHTKCSPMTGQYFHLVVTRAPYWENRLNHQIPAGRAGTALQCARRSGYYFLITLT